MNLSPITYPNITNYEPMEIEPRLNNQSTASQTKKQSPLQLTTMLEKSSIPYTQVDKCWGMVTLSATDCAPPPSICVDWVVVIDISASMNVEDKLFFVICTIEYLISKLDSHHRFSLIAFNHTTSVEINMIPVTPENKTAIRDCLNRLQPSGATNIPLALFKGLELLGAREEAEKSRISTIMLFTDGLSNRGLSSRDTLDKLSTTLLPEGCVINTFGYGSDHDSKLLHAIALRSKGVYYFIERKEDIAPTFGECVAGILSTVAHHIVVKLRGLDGGRIVTLATPYTVVEKKVAKDYDVKMGLIFAGESKSILFKLSLRKMHPDIIEHKLTDITVEYNNALTGKMESISTVISVKRNEKNTAPSVIPIILDQHINRYAAAVAITEAIELSKKCNYVEAQKKLGSLIYRIEKSVSAKNPYCKDLIADLVECKNGMKDYDSFSTGIHCAHAYSAMYYMERSTGQTLKKQNKTNETTRSSGYGYFTTHQQEEALRAKNYVCQPKLVS
eukprot:TRINITY_DN2177_c0_g2_i1.p1 TRINITY_DN2177_c0_g2~~TRINITY_DN2177_c0_g2_i1.p1  ORF type:complete len:503 (-),score=63.46 TRINITY_DN2177_c0_g2_i1:138-1646(-)